MTTLIVLLACVFVILLIWHKLCQANKVIDAILFLEELDKEHRTRPHQGHRIICNDPELDDRLT